MSTALIVEGDPRFLESHARLVRGEGFETLTAGSICLARRVLERHAVDVAFTESQLPDGAGLELLDALQDQPDAQLVMITGNGSIDAAVEAMQRGVSEYLTKPVDIGRLTRILSGVRTRVERRQLEDDLELPLRREGLGCMVGFSESIQRVYELIAKVAPTESTVFITGETGVGKELVARQLHAMSARADRAFIPINCGAIPATLFESELFGHEKGSFTDASRRRDGILRQADLGTLFLDEVTELPLELQVKLLRVLETGSFTPVGGDRPVQTDLRIVAASNRDPEQAVATGRLREDLLYRLNVFPIDVPPLRERVDDIEPLACHLLEAVNRGGKGSKRLGADAIGKLIDHPWPGNVRELRNVIERAAILAGDLIGADDISLKAVTPPYCRPTISVAVGSSIEDVERRLILATMSHVRGKKQSAAELLGISLKTLYSRLKDYEGVKSWPGTS